MVFSTWTLTHALTAVNHYIAFGVYQELVGGNPRIQSVALPLYN